MSSTPPVCFLSRKTCSSGRPVHSQSWTALCLFNVVVSHGNVVFVLMCRCRCLRPRLSASFPVKHVVPAVQSIPSLGRLSVCSMLLSHTGMLFSFSCVAVDVFDPTCPRPFPYIEWPLLLSFIISDAALLRNQRTSCISVVQNRAASEPAVCTKTMCIQE